MNVVLDNNSSLPVEFDDTVNNVDDALIKDYCFH